MGYYSSCPIQLMNLLYLIDEFFNDAPPRDPPELGPGSTAVTFEMPFTGEAMDLWRSEMVSGTGYAPVGQTTAMQAAQDPGGGLRFWRNEATQEITPPQRNISMFYEFADEDNPEQFVNIHLDANMIVDIEAPRRGEADFIIRIWDEENSQWIDLDFNDFNVHWGWVFPEGPFTIRQMFTATLPWLGGISEETRAYSMRILDIANVNDGYVPVQRAGIAATISINAYGPDNSGVARRVSFGIREGTAL